MKINNKKKISIILIIIIASILILAIILVKKYNPENENFFAPCIIYKLTGVKCPGCGMTRSVHNLLNGNIKEAIWYNAMLIPSILVIIYAIYKYIRYLIKDEEFFDKKFEIVLIIFLIMLLIFAVVRNFITIIY